jgi:hypothetical protein
MAALMSREGSIFCALCNLQAGADQLIAMCCSKQCPHATTLETTVPAAAAALPQVGAQTETELKEKKLRAEDALITTALND